jgi:hypothetical protein
MRGSTTHAQCCDELMILDCNALQTQSHASVRRLHYPRAAAPGEARDRAASIGLHAELQHQHHYRCRRCHHNPFGWCGAGAGESLIRARRNRRRQPNAAAPSAQPERRGNEGRDGPSAQMISEAEAGRSQRRFERALCTRGGGNKRGLFARGGVVIEAIWGATASLRCTL